MKHANKNSKTKSTENKTDKINIKDVTPPLQQKIIIK